MNSFNTEKVKLACVGWLGLDIKDKKFQESFRYVKCLCYPEKVEIVINIIDLCNKINKPEINLSMEEFSIISKYYHPV